MTVIAGSPSAAPGQKSSTQAGSAVPARSNGAAPAPFISRDPEVRLEALFDPGSVRLLTPHDSSGEVAALGTIDGMTAVAFASDPRVQGGAMGSEGCAAIVAAYDEALAQGEDARTVWRAVVVHLELPASRR